jgi:uncharacterized protein (TIGR03067 family)
LPRTIVRNVSFVGFFIPGDCDEIALIMPMAVLFAVGCSNKDNTSQKNTPTSKDSQTADQKDQKGLPGTWKVVSIGGNGKTMSLDRVADMKVTISGQQYTTTKSGKIVEQATLATDPSKKPKTIDLVITQGESKGQTLLGIYDIEGDTLRISFAEPGKVRPTEYTNRAGLPLDIWELRRE